MFTNRYYTYALAAALVGLICCGLLFGLVRRFEDKATENRFMAQASQAAAAMESEVELFVNVLKSLSDLHGISDRINQDIFGEFVEKGLVYHKDILTVFCWAPLIERDQRLPFERAMQQAGYRGFSVVEPRDHGGAGRAAVRDFYVPVSYIEPTDVDTMLPGYDLAFAMPNRAAIKALIDGHDVYAGARIRLRVNHQPMEGRFIFAPINLATSGAPSGIAGVVTAVLQPDKIIRRVLKNPDQFDLHVAIYENTPADENELMLLRQFGSKKEAPGEGVRSALVYSRDITFAGMSWRIVCRPSGAFLQETKSYLSWLSLLVGILITLFITFQMVSLAGRTIQIEGKVARRTLQLNTANEALTSEISRRKGLEREILDISNREKQRLGRDIHDSLGQKLSGLLYLSKALIKTLTDEHSDSVATAKTLNEQLKETTSQARMIARGLSPIDLSGGGLSAALRRLLEETAQIYRLQHLFEAPPCADDISGVVANQLYQIAQEAVNNAVKHAAPTSITVRILSERVGSHDMLLAVEDDGKGFQESSENRGMGTQIMQYRADVIGGSISVHSQPGSGTTVECRFSLSQQTGTLV